MEVPVTVLRDRLPGFPHSEKEREDLMIAAVGPLLAPAIYRKEGELKRLPLKNDLPGGPPSNRWWMACFAYLKQQKRSGADKMLCSYWWTKWGLFGGSMRTHERQNASAIYLPLNQTGPFSYKTQSHTQAFLPNLLELFIISNRI